MKFICYPKCSTCKKAQKWLDAAISPMNPGHHTGKPTEAELKEWHAKTVFLRHSSIAVNLSLHEPQRQNSPMSETKSFSPLHRRHVRQTPFLVTTTKSSSGLKKASGRKRSGSVPRFPALATQTIITGGLFDSFQKIDEDAGKLLRAVVVNVMHGFKASHQYAVGQELHDSGGVFFVHGCQEYSVVVVITRGGLFARRNV